MMFRTCRARVKSSNPAICGNRTVMGTNKIFKCTGYCSSCKNGCRNLRTAQRKTSAAEICAVDPDYVYTHVSGLHGNQKCSNKDHPGYGQFQGNSNGDFFWWKETLLAHKPEFGVDHAFQTWIGKDNLENHDETRVLGDIPDVWPSMRDRSIDMLIRTSVRRAWSITESIRKGAVTDVSMGTLVNHSFCSICDNRAETEEQWCDHLKYAKGQFLGPDELSSKDRYQFPDGKWCYEDNRDIYGIEVSWITVGEGADPEAKVKNLIAGFGGPAGKQFAHLKQGKRNVSVVDLYFTNRRTR